MEKVAAWPQSNQEFVRQPSRKLSRRVAASALALATILPSSACKDDGGDTPPTPAKAQPTLELPKDSLPDATKNIYLAAGDSYSAGEGTPILLKDSQGNDIRTYLTGTDTPTDHCHRSVEAYPAKVWEGLGPAEWSLDFRACSGAVLDDFFHQNHGNPTEKPQISKDPPPNLKLVTFSMGGNDLGFSRIITKCLADSDTQPLKTLHPFTSCRTLGGPFVDISMAMNVHARLPLYYQALRKAVGKNTRVIVLGYPQPFPDDPPKICDLGSGGKVSHDDMKWLNEIDHDLNKITKKAAAKQNFSYVDVTKLFFSDGKRHDVCAPNEPDRWMNRLRLTGPRKIESFHPMPQAHAIEGAMVLKCYREPATCNTTGDNPLKALGKKLPLEITCEYSKPEMVGKPIYADVNHDNIKDALFAERCSSSTSSQPETVGVINGASADPKHPDSLGLLLEKEAEKMYTLNLKITVDDKEQIEVNGDAVSAGGSVAVPDDTFRRHIRWENGKFVGFNAPYGDEH